MKKKIYLVFNDREKEATWRHLYEGLLMVFEEYVEVKLCFLNETNPEDIQDGDLYLVPMRNYQKNMHL